MKTVITAILSIIATSLWWIGALWVDFIFIPALLLSAMVLCVLCGEIFINWR